jgi:hypothetical protein
MTPGRSEAVSVNKVSQGHIELARIRATVLKALHDVNTRETLLELARDKLEKKEAKRAVEKSNEIDLIKLNRMQTPNQSYMAVIAKRNVHYFKRNMYLLNAQHRRMKGLELHRIQLQDNNQRWEVFRIKKNEVINRYIEARSLQEKCQQMIVITKFNVLIKRIAAAYN